MSHKPAWGGKPAKLFEFVGVLAFIQHAGQHEQSAGGDAVVQHLVNGAIRADGREAEDAQHYKTKVADGRVRNQLLQIRLNQRNQRAINDSDHGQHIDPA